MVDSDHRYRAPTGKVWLRLAPEDRSIAIERLALPREVGTANVGAPMILCVAPDRWLFLSERQSSDELISTCFTALSGLLFAAGDASSELLDIEFKGPGARTLLSAGTGIDTDVRALRAGTCRACLFARTAAIVYCVGPQHLRLLVDRSVHGYILEWLDHAMRDPTFVEKTVHLNSAQ